MDEKERFENRMDEAMSTIKMPQIIMKENPQELLRIATRIDQFVTDNGWSWCTMDRVYRVLKAIHQ